MSEMSRAEAWEAAMRYSDLAALFGSTSEGERMRRLSAFYERLSGDWPNRRVFVRADSAGATARRQATSARPKAVPSGST
jgi:hypothetical protein